LGNEPKRVFAPLFLSKNLFAKDIARQNTEGFLNRFCKNSQMPVLFLGKHRQYYTISAQDASKNKHKEKEA
jgi:hypothetical protein